MRCRYWDERTFREIDESYEKVLGQIVKMASQPEKCSSIRGVASMSDESPGRPDPARRRDRELASDANSPTLRHADSLAQTKTFLIERIIDASARNAFSSSSSRCSGSQAAFGR